jgi:hypothetical protein
MCIEAVGDNTNSGKAKLIQPKVYQKL